jgi:hypothetical protein
MSTRRIDMDRLQELVRLHRMGTGAREVARLLRMGPNTEPRGRVHASTAALPLGPQAADSDSTVMASGTASSADHRRWRCGCWLVLACRRYRCVHCEAVLTVVPRGVAPPATLRLRGDRAGAHAVGDRPGSGS